MLVCLWGSTAGLVNLARGKDNTHLCLLMKEGRTEQKLERKRGAYSVASRGAFRSEEAFSADPESKVGLVCSGDKKDIGTE